MSRRKAVSSSTRTGSASFMIRGLPSAWTPSHFWPTMAIRRSLDRNASSMCLRKSTPNGTLSMSMKRLVLPKCCTSRSKMRPAMAASDRR